MIRQSNRHKDCNCLMEDLLHEELKTSDDCSVCLAYGVRCFVGSHPSRGNQLLYLYKLFTTILI